MYVYININRKLALFPVALDIHAEPFGILLNGRCRIVLQAITYVYHRMTMPSNTCIDTINYVYLHMCEFSKMERGQNCGPCTVNKLGILQVSSIGLFSYISVSFDIFSVAQ